MEEERKSLRLVIAFHVVLTKFQLRLNVFVSFNAGLIKYGISMINVKTVQNILDLKTAKVIVQPTIVKLIR